MLELCFNGETLKVKVSSYPSGNTRVDLLDDDGLTFSMPSCEVEGILLKPGYALVRTWSHNKDIMLALITQGIIESTGYYLPVSDYADALICKVKTDDELRLDDIAMQAAKEAADMAAKEAAES